MIWLNGSLQYANSTIQASDYVKKYKAIGLFFSAKWCSPCVEFEKKLDACVKNINMNDENFGIIIICDDKDEQEFNDHISSVIWPCIKFSDFRLKKRLKHRYHVTGLPKLVIVDSESGNVLNHDAKANVEDDLEGVEFPWKDPTVAELLKGSVIHEGQTHRLDEYLKEKTVLGLYFSADWCPPCRQFSPLLTTLHAGLKENGFEVLYCSMDKVEEKFVSTVKTMPWLCIPWRDGRIRLLAKALQVEDIPQLVMWDLKLGEVINRNAITRIRNDPVGKQFPWKRELVTILTMGNISDMSSSVVFLFITANMDGVHTLLPDLALTAERYHDFRFYVASDEDVVVARLRDILQIGDQCPYILFLDFESKTWARCSNRRPEIQDLEPFVDAVSACEVTLTDFPSNN